LEPNNEGLKQSYEQIVKKIQAAEHNVNGEEVKKQNKCVCV
jgi:hypothetical protein